jgi:hypothetical protein
VSSTGSVGVESACLARSACREGRQESRGTGLGVWPGSGVLARDRRGRGNGSWRRAGVREQRERERKRRVGGESPWRQLGEDAGAAAA